MRKHLLFIFCLVIFISCRRGINDKSKRNDHWAWYVDTSGNGKWIPIVKNEPTNLSNGKVTFFYFNGNIYQIVKLRDAKLCDTTFRYDINGAPDSYIVEGDTQRFYFFNNGPYKRFFSDGHIYAEGVVENHDAGNFWKEYYKNGKVSIYYNLQGKGVYYSYFENGNMESKQIGEFIRLNNIHKVKLENGTLVTYYENGIKRDSINHVNGEVDGICYIWFDNGAVRTIMNFSKGVPEGNISGYYENGKLRYSMTMKNGKPDGVYMKYDSLGNHVDDILFKNGLKVN